MFMLAGLFGPSEGVTSREWWRFPSPITVLPRDGRGPDCSPASGLPHGAPTKSPASDRVVLGVLAEGTPTQWEAADNARTAKAKT